MARSSNPSAATTFSSPQSSGLKDSLEPNSEEILDAIIIGAGWAGIGAANLLVKRGMENIRVLEAKDHIGGRAYTEMHEWEGRPVPIDMGAMWIHGGSENILNTLALKYKIRADVSGYDTMILNKEAGINYDKDQVEALRVKFFEEGFYSFQSQRQTTTEHDEPLQKSCDLFLNQLATKHEKQLTKFFLRTGIELEYSGLLSQHSLWWWNDDYDLGGSLGLEGYFVPGGHSALMQPFASYLTDHNKIQLDSKVTCIDYQNEDIIQVHCSCEDGSSIICKAKKVIVTVPLGVLKADRIAFVPKLPKRAQKAIRRIGMGKMNKIFLFWSQEDVFWPADVEIFGDIEERDTKMMFRNPQKHNGNLPMLFGFFQGTIADAAEEAFADSDPAEYEKRIQDLAMESLRTMFGEDIPEPKKVIVTKWNVDECSLGAYSFNKVGMGKHDRTKLAQPVGKDQVFFAGEATHRRYFATTAGAFMSGRAAARKVLRSFKEMETEAEPMIAKRQNPGFNGIGKDDNSSDLNSNPIPILPRDSKHLLLDIEGCTTSINFVMETLFPYAAENVGAYVDSLTYSEQEELLESLKADLSPAQLAEVEDTSSIVSIVRAAIEKDLKLASLKSLQGRIWQRGYEERHLQGHVYDDLLPALEWLEQHEVKVHTYSSGSVQAQKLLFGNSCCGDLTKFFASHFDITTSGNKKESTSYGKIAAHLGVDPSEIVFCSDSEAELEAAKEAGIGHLIMTVRPGNAPISAVGKKKFPRVLSLLQLCGA